MFPGRRSQAFWLRWLVLYPQAVAWSLLVVWYVHNIDSFREADLKSDALWRAEQASVRCPAPPS